MFRLANSSFFRFSSTYNILKNFGITNPNILRNLTYSESYAVFQNSMKLALIINQQILSPKTA